MKIILFSPTWPQYEDANGVVTYCANMKLALEKAGHSVIILTSRLEMECDENVFEISYRPSLIKGLIVRLREYFDPGYAQYFYGSRAIAATLKKIKRKYKSYLMEIEESFGWHKYIAPCVNFPVVMRLHGTHFLNCKVAGKAMDQYDVNRIRRERESFENALYVNSPSNWVIKKINQEYQKNWQTTAVFGNPIDVDGLSSWCPDSFNEKVLLFVVRLDRLKGGDIIIKAFAGVLSAYPDVRLVFAGPDSGVILDDGQVAHMQDLLAINVQKDSRSQVLCLGKVDKKTIDALRVQSSIAITASRSEVFGYSVLESMAAGMPVFAPCVAGVAELFEDGVSGLYFLPENAESMTDKIVDLINDKSKAISLGQQSRLRVEREFSIDVIAKKVVSHYEKVIIHDKDFVNKVN